LLRRLKIESKKQAQKGVSLKTHNRTIGVVFSYEELNTNVLFNAVLRNLKRNNSVKVIAYVPAGFGKLFFSADEIIEIPNYLNKFKKYSEVSEYFPPSPHPEKTNSFFNKIWNKVKYILIRFYKKILVYVKLSDQRLVTALRVIATYRQRYFLYKSGVWKWVLRDFRSRAIKSERWVIFPVQDYISISESHLEIKTSSLGASFEYLFSELYLSITDGIIEEYKQKFCVISPQKAPKSIYFRTRNYEQKQQVHNTTKSNVLDLIIQLLDKNVRVMNIGSPALSLKNDLKPRCSKNYQELSNVLSIDEELEILEGPIVCRADAGLFVLIACLPVPIICLTPEWSESFGVRLMKARAKYGIEGDLDFSPLNSKEIILAHAMSFFERS
jgi:hypothetical protein